MTQTSRYPKRFKTILFFLILILLLLYLTYKYNLSFAEMDNISDEKKKLDKETENLLILLAVWIYFGGSLICLFIWEFIKLFS